MTAGWVTAGWAEGAASPCCSLPPWGAALEAPTGSLLMVTGLPGRSLPLPITPRLTLGAASGSTSHPHHPGDKGLEGWGPWGRAILVSPAAPEVVGRQRYGRPVDCWAIGVIMYIL